jgi:hypothetical protein
VRWEGTLESDGSLSFLPVRMKATSAACFVEQEFGYGRVVRVQLEAKTKTKGSSMNDGGYSSSTTSSRYWPQRRLLESGGFSLGMRR